MKFTNSVDIELRGVSSNQTLSIFMSEVKK